MSDEVSKSAGPSETVIQSRPTDEQIAQWKQKHKEIHLVEIDGYAAILRKARMWDLERAMKADKKPGAKPMDFNREIVAHCLLYIDPEFRNDDERELALLTSVGELASIREAAVKKL